ncbi:MAG: hypothetical protein LBH28_02005, partial [Oscillospiraceae bacterium]|nr:hypothetical protein [Oscillospiraceae bacterium]
MVFTRNPSGRREFYEILRGITATRYVTRQLKIGKTKQLDRLAREAGEVYSQTVVAFWRIVRHKNHWLSSNAMQKIIHNGNLHSQTVQGIIQAFYEALRSWEALRKNGMNAKPPRRLNRYYSIPFKSSAIALKDGTLKLSIGKGIEPLCIPWRFARPKVCEISYNGAGYVLNAVYTVANASITTEHGCAGIDL